ncbi:MAG: hypothetical protein ABI760_20950 [Ferruginibacter sp.]
MKFSFSSRGWYGIVNVAAGMKRICLRTLPLNEETMETKYNVYFQVKPPC